MPIPTNVIPHEGDLAFAVSVSTLYDLTVGLATWPVYLTKHSHATTPTLTLRNLTPGGPVLDILGWDGDSWEIVTRFTGEGIARTQVGEYIDFKYQPDHLGANPPFSNPPSPGAGTDTIRMYARGGQLYFKAEESDEQQIPVGDPPGPSLRYSYWMSGG
jgi:hypothetical protein